jgi:ferric-dicitrate binding protein FerR (iron transport regulator)
MTGEPERAGLQPEEQERRRRGRSIAIALALAALAVLFFITTIVRLGGNVADRAF